MLHDYLAIKIHPDKVMYNPRAPQISKVILIMSHSDVMQFRELVFEKGKK